MSQTSARQTRQIMKNFASKLTGRGERGPDHSDQQGVRVPRRNSFDENDPKARPWSRVGDGTVAQGLMFREALIEAAEQLYRQLWKETSSGVAREAQVRHHAASAELDGWLAASPADRVPGRAAVLRQELAEAKAILDRAAVRIQRVDLDVLRALHHFINFTTGELFPSYDAIAMRARCHRNSVAAALKRLKHHGLLDWVRRTTKTGNEGEFAPQREQTSNAYILAVRPAMAKRTWETYWKLLVAKLRRVGAHITRKEAPPEQRTAAYGPLREVLATLGAGVNRASSAST